jgi:Rrf2 family iron-sulfur cluster assembly transcriptional regulator
MQLSTKGRYAVMAMTDLAGQDGARATPLAAIAARQQISRPYLEQLFARLRRRGLVSAVPTWSRRWMSPSAPHAVPAANVAA